MEKYSSAMGLSIESNAIHEEDRLLLQRHICDVDAEWECLELPDNQTKDAEELIKAVAFLLYANSSIRSVVLGIPSRACYSKDLPYVLQKLFAQLNQKHRINVENMLDAIPEFWQKRLPLKADYFLEKLVKVLHNASKPNARLCAQIERLFFPIADNIHKDMVVMTMCDVAMESIKLKKFSSLPMVLFVKKEDFESSIVFNTLHLNHNNTTFCLWSVVKIVEGDVLLFVQPHLNEWKQLENGKFVSVSEEIVFLNQDSICLLGYERSNLLLPRKVDKLLPLTCIECAGDIVVGTCGATWSCETHATVFSSPKFELYGYIWQMRVAGQYALQLNVEYGSNIVEIFSEVCFCVFLRTNEGHNRCSSSLVVNNSLDHTNSWMRMSLDCNASTVGFVVKVTIRRSLCGPLTGLPLQMFTVLKECLGADVCLKVKSHLFKVNGVFLLARWPHLKTLLVKSVNNVVELPFMAPHIMDQILLYLYTAQLPPLQHYDEVTTLANAASQLQILDLKEALNSCTWSSSSREALQSRIVGSPGNTLLECSSMATVLWDVNVERKNPICSPLFQIGGRSWQMRYDNGWLHVEDKSDITDDASPPVCAHYHAECNGDILSWITSSTPPFAFLLKEVHGNISVLFGLLSNYEIDKETASGLHLKLTTDIEALASLQTDMKVVGKGGSVNFHTTILAASSKYFMRMLLSGLRESKTGEVHLMFEVEVLRHLRKFMYYGNLPTRETDLYALKDAADYLQMEDLVLKCDAKLQQDY